MRAQPELYEQLKGKTTKLGVNLGHCIKTGIDNKGIFLSTKSTEVMKGHEGHIKYHKVIQ